MRFKVVRTWRGITYDSPPVSELSAAMVTASQWQVVAWIIAWFRRLDVQRRFRLFVLEGILNA